jgi:hypothetical protein
MCQRYHLLTWPRSSLLPGNSGVCSTTAPVYPSYRGAACSLAGRHCLIRVGKGRPVLSNCFPVSSPPFPVKTYIQVSVYKDLASNFQPLPLLPYRGSEGSRRLSKGVSSAIARRATM